MFVPMPTELQINANRENSQKSTGPRSPEGKAKSRFNALKFGIHARSQVIPGEDPAELEAIAGQYRLEFSPSSRTKVVLVNTLIAADWQLQRLRQAEAQLWEWELAQGGNLGEVYSRNPAVARLHREMRATQRVYERTLQQVGQMEKEEAQKEAQLKRAAEAPRRAARVAEIYESLVAAGREAPQQGAAQETAGNKGGVAVRGGQSGDPEKKGES